MPGFTYPISSVVFGLMAIGVYYAIYFIPTNENKKDTAFLIFICLLGFLELSPASIIDNRKYSDFRDKKIHNTAVFKQLDEEKLKNYYIFNAKSYEDNEIMFYKNLNVYHWYPLKENLLDSLVHSGYKIAMFDYPAQPAPEQYRKNPNILLIPIDFK